MSGSRIRPAGTADFEAFYRRPPRWRVKAVVAEDDAGEALGIGGMEFQPTGLCVFMDVARDVEPAAHKRLLLRAARRVLSAAAATRRPIFAIRDPDVPGSETFLTHFGFAPLSGPHDQEVWRKCKQ